MYNRVSKKKRDRSLSVTWNNYSFLSPTDVLGKGIWSTLEKFQKPELRALAEALKSTILSSRAASTISKYVNAFLRWKRWAQQYEGFEVVPAKEAEFALYLQFISASTASKAAVEEAVNGVSWVQQLAGFPPLSDSPFISIVLDGLQRRLAKPTIRKEPVSNDMIVALVNSLCTPSGSLHASFLSILTL